MKANIVEQREFLLSCAIWQDSLLQSYRSLHVTIQGLLTAAGATVLAVQLTGAIQEQGGNAATVAVFNALFTALVGFLFWLQMRTNKELKGVVESRALDVNHWHKLVILSENELAPSQREFTYFKIWQHAKRASVEHVLPRFMPAEGLAAEDAEILIGKGLGHTRRILDFNLFERLQHLWTAMIIGSVGVSGWFMWLWWLSRSTAA